MVQRRQDCFPDLGQQIAVAFESMLLTRALQVNAGQ